MLDNDASPSSVGMNAYIRYCAYKNTTLKLRPGSRSFKVMGHGVVDPLGTAGIRMPTGEHFFIEFDADVVSHDITLIFWTRKSQTAPL